MAGGHSSGGGMIRTILIWTGIIIVILLVLLWFITGGVRKVINAAHNIGNPISYIFGFASSAGQPFRLPWQPETMNYGSTIDTGGSDEPTSEDDLSQAEKDYEATQKQLAEARNFGTPSPFRDKVRIVDSGAENDVAEEYIVIEASGDTTAPINVTGWSLQSAITGVRGYIPRTTDVFVMGAVNQQKDLSLGGGASAVLATGYSPVGTSFRENICSGYLSQLRSFTPSISRECPSPSDRLPLNSDNIRTYGDSCIDFVASLPACFFPATVPAELSSNCRTFVQTDLSYNGCVQTYRYKTTFLKDQHRMYLGASAELWKNSHDVIRLLDTEGRTVDVLSY